MLLTPAQIKPKSFESWRTFFFFFFFYPGWMRLMECTCVLRRLVASTVLSVPTLRAPFSGTFLQTLPDLVTSLMWRGTLYLRAAVQRRGQRPPKGQSGTGHTPSSRLPGTFLQTLPDFVTALKGHSSVISAQLSSDAISALRKVRVLIYDCRSNLAPKHARKHETHPPRVKKKGRRVASRFQRLWFYLCWCKLCWRLYWNDTPCFIWVVCNKITTIWAPTKNCSLADSFQGPMA